MAVLNTSDNVLLSSQYIFLRTLNISLNFWEENPHTIYVFQEFYDQDKSKNKHKSSQILWAITLLVHPNSDFFQLSEPDRIRFIKEDYLKDLDFDFQEYRDLIEIFKKHCITREQRFLVNLAQKVDERDNFIASIPYTEQHIDLLEKLLKNSKDIMIQYNSIKSLVQEQEQTTFGSIVESAS